MKKRIQVVIKKRKIARDKADRVIQLIITLIDDLSQLNKIKETIEKANTKIELKIRTEIEDYITELVVEKQYWQKIRDRFDRNTLNIGVVGKMGQGKSTFLQSITSLTDEHIPAKSGPACTSTQSIIKHSPKKEYAVIHYYSEQEFIEEVLSPYYHYLSEVKQLGINNLPSSIKEFENISLPLPISVLNYLGEKKQKWYENILEIQSTLPQYKKLLSGKLEEINIDEVKRYVQYKYNKKGQKSSHIYNAIRKIEIFTKFTNSSIDNLGLIDIPGLGDYRLGDEERMIRSIGEDVDIILFLRKVDQDRDQWQPTDTDLYESAKIALQDKLPLEKWSFMLLNNRNDNLEDCERLKREVYSEGKIRTVKSFIANCIDTKESATVLGQVIDYLVENIEELDNIIVKNSNKTLSSILNKLQNDLNDSCKLIGRENTFEIFNQEFDAFYRKLSVELYNYRNQLLDHNTIREEFIEEIKSVITECIRDVDTTLRLPTEEEFNENGIIRRSKRGEWDRLMHHIRPMLLKQFHRISYKQEETIDRQKRNISELLAIPSLLGNLNKDKSNLLFLLRDLINENMPENSDIRTGFNFICDFRFSYEGYVQTFIYGTIQEFFSKDIKELGSGPKIIKVIKDTKEAITYIKEENNGSLNNNNLKDIARLIVSGTKLLCELSFIPGVIGTLLSSIEDFGLSIIKFSEKEQNFEEGEVLLLEKKAITIQNELELREGEITALLELKESIDSIPNLIEFALKECEERLISKIAGWPEQVSISMVEEFIDHVRYTNSSRSDWRKLMYFLGKFIWTDYSNSEKLIKVNEMWKDQVNIISNQVNNFLSAHNNGYKQ